MAKIPKLKVNVNVNGLICPWCADKQPIMKCSHNPFKLMEEVDSLTNDVKNLNTELAQLGKLKEGLQLLHEALDE